MNRKKEEFTVPTLNDGFNVVNVLRKIVLFNEQFHIHCNSDGFLIIQSNVNYKISMHYRRVPKKLKLQILCIQNDIYCTFLL